jgi:Ca2+/Na+ antiporter
MINLGYTTIHRPTLFWRLMVFCVMQGAMAGAMAFAIFTVAAAALTSGNMHRFFSQGSDVTMGGLFGGVIGGAIGFAAGCIVGIETCVFNIPFNEPGKYRRNVTIQCFAVTSTIVLLLMRSMVVPADRGMTALAIIGWILVVLLTLWSSRRITGWYERYWANVMVMRALDGELEASADPALSDGIGGHAATGRAEVEESAEARIGR